MSLVVERAEGLVTVQDRGRFGYGHLGVPRAGALDAPAAELANRLVGNPADHAVLEVTMAGLRVRTDRALTLAVTGAECTVLAGDRACAFAEPVTVPAGTVVDIGVARRGVRTYVAVAGGIAVPPVLGSRSTDTLAWVGPPLVVAGTVLPVGSPMGSPQPADVTRRTSEVHPVRLLAGPRADWFESGSLGLLAHAAYAVTADSNRIGLRLRGPALKRVGGAELASEGMVSGAVQVPPDGQPVVLLHDHPVTGGYPVIAVVDSRDLAACAQLRPGETVRFSLRDGSRR